MEVSLMEMLEAREKRAWRQRELLKRGQTVICFTMNIAGPIKNSPLIGSGYDLGKRLLLGQLSRNLIVEEYPLSEPSITLASDGVHWILDIEVASFLGIGRFVMGLYDDIKVLGDEQFKAYIKEKVDSMKG